MLPGTNEADRNLRIGERSNCYEKEERCLSPILSFLCSSPPLWPVHRHPNRKVRGNMLTIRLSGVIKRELPSGRLLNEETQGMESIMQKETDKETNHDGSESSGRNKRIIKIPPEEKMLEGV